MQFLEKRFLDLSRTAYQRDIVTYTDFLNLNEQNILHGLPKNQLFSRYQLFGGYDTAERQMAAFIPDALYLRYGKSELSPVETGYPFCAVRISPLQRKYAEKLTHRDYLGAVLNLGMERSKTGDIIPWEENMVIFIHRDMSELLLHELKRIRHTSVSAVEFPAEEINNYTPGYEEIRGTAASVRLDSLLALAFSSSRTKLSGLIEGARVFVNGRLVTSNGYQPKPGDVISVRGMGKFRFAGKRFQFAERRVINADTGNKRPAGFVVAGNPEPNGFVGGKFPQRIVIIRQ